MMGAPTVFFTGTAAIMRGRGQGRRPDTQTQGGSFLKRRN